MTYDDTIFNAEAKNRLVRIFLVGFIIGGLTGLITAGLAVAEKAANG